MTGRTTPSDRFRSPSDIQIAGQHLMILSVTKQRARQAVLAAPLS